MRTIYKVLMSVFVASVMLTGCDDILEVDSDRFLNSKDNLLDSPNDTLYSMVGIQKGIQKVAERFIILGELRGDLVDLTKEATGDLIEINNFEVSDDNQYNNIRDYYEIINNCNYLINNIDTSVVSGAIKVMYREYAAAKAYRAWAYMQIALNYDTVKYYTQPILSIEDAKKEYPKINMKELAPLLIADLLPVKDVIPPEYGAFGEMSTSHFFFPVRFLLGELYLWDGQYEMAANEYHDLIYLERAITNFSSNSIALEEQTLRSYWKVINGVFINAYHEWFNIFYDADWETQSEIGTTSVYGEGSHLINLSFGSTAQIKPSAPAINNWKSQVYYADTLTMISGDLRGEMESYRALGYTLDANNQWIPVGSDVNIFKYYVRSAAFDEADDYELITTCRSGLLYLRYAEAVNRLGKPNLAFAVLKNGLNLLNMANPKIVPKHELTVPKLNYMNFDDVRFANNIGMHARGCGYINKSKEYKIPTLINLDDSVAYVEDMIQLELALETAFEGNRFYDLMRIALRRQNPAYLADKVASKHTNNQEAIRSKLLNPKNWYLPAQK